MRRIGDSGVQEQIEEYLRHNAAQAAYADLFIRAAGAYRAMEDVAAFTAAPTRSQRRSTSFLGWVAQEVQAARSRVGKTAVPADDTVIEGEVIRRSSAVDANERQPSASVIVVTIPSDIEGEVQARFHTPSRDRQKGDYR